MYIEKINTPEDIKKYNINELEVLAQELREAIINKVSDCGGHLASNLGIVELTIALHYVFDAPKDKLVFDVSHQTYCHKMLTGRKAAFIKKENYKDVTGFSNPKESEYDLFALGHTSTSISLACGLAKARDLKHDSENVIAVIGDASLDGGEAFEALNCAAEINSSLIVVINDNEMSIPENHGALGRHLKQLKESAGKQKDNFFKALGFEYHLIENGNDLESVIKELESVKDTKVPVVVHVCTQKGKGYKPAEENSENWHWARPFDKETGKNKNAGIGENYGNIVGEHLLNRIQNDPEVAVIAASTPICIGFDKTRRELAGKQYIDVGIAEQNAVTMAVGMAKRGCKPVFATNSTFIQRAYDQILHDVCIQELHVVFAIDRAGLVGSDGETHQGIFDISYLSTIPNMTIMAPKNKWELSDMIKYAVDFSAPIAIRYPRGEAYDGLREYRAPIACGKSEWIYRSGQIALFALGAMVKTAEAVHERLKALGYESSLINARFAKPLDEDALLSAARHHDLIVTMEENVISGGMGEQVMRFYEEHNLSVRVLAIAIPDEYVEHGNVEILRREVGIDAETITERTIEAYEELHAQESGAERNDF